MDNVMTPFRTVTFRGWNGESWAEGSLVQNDGKCYIWKDGDVVEVKSESVGQWTGLADTNGTRIFEGDMVKISFPWTAVSLPFELGVHRVEFVAGAFCMVMGKNITPVSGYAPRVVFEVVGNAFRTEEEGKCG
jgi:uncharacterized phage protein (TIGR01671 family)